MAPQPAQPRGNVCVTTETRPLDRLGQLGEFEQDSNTDSELESNTDSQGVCYMRLTRQLGWERTRTERRRDDAGDVAWEPPQPHALRRAGLPRTVRQLVWERTRPERRRIAVSAGIMRETR